MNLGDVTKKVVPKMMLVAPPAQAARVHAAASSRTVPCHDRRASARSASPPPACSPGSPAAASPGSRRGREKTLSVEHPTGEFSVVIEVGGTAEHPVVERAGLLRTARLLFEGSAFAPARILAITRRHRPRRGLHQSDE